MGRKPILQFDDNKTNSSQPSSSGNNLRGLIHYDDSEDSSGSGQEEESCVSSAGESAPKETKQLDLEVADFFKEIDAMTTNDAQDTSEAEAKSDENDVLDKDSVVVDNHTDQANSSVSTNVPESCSWQQCYDETSGYTYFWNTKTNEVTWESPLEYKEYLERMQAKETAKKAAQNHSDSLYVTNGEASTSSAGRVTVNGGGSSIVSFKNSSKPPKKRAHNLIEGKIEPITIFGPSTSDSSDEESSTKSKKKKIILNQPDLHYGPYLPEQPIAVADISIIEVDRLSVNSVDNEEKSNEVTVSESSHPSSSSNRVEVRAEYAMDLTRGPVTQSTENGRSPPEIQVGNVSDSEVQNSEENVCEPELMSEVSVSQPSTSSDGFHHSHSDHSSGFCPNEDEPDSTCTSKIERHFRKSKSSRQPVGCSLPQSLQFLSQYEVSDGDSDRETPEPSPLELSAKSSPVNNAEVEELLERNQLEQASNSTESDVVSGPTIDSGESSPNNRVSDSEARVVPISSPENMEDQPSGSQDDEIDLDEIEKELDRALERKACESSRNNDSPRPSQRENSEENAQSVPGDNSPEAGPSLSQEELELFSSDIIGKLELLTTNRAQIQLLSTLLIMVDVRLTDWRNGALPSFYFMNRLCEANDVLKQYEDSAVPTGWTCNWDRDERRYFYTNIQTGRSQTEFPVESVEENSSNVADNQNEQPHTPITYESILSGTHSSAGQHPVVTSSTAEGLFRSVAKNTNRTGSSVSMVQSGEASCSFQTSDQSTSASSNREEIVQAQIELPIEIPPPPTSPPPSTPPLPKSPPPSPPDSTDAGDSRHLPNGAIYNENSNQDHLLSSSHHALPQPICQIPPLVPSGLPVIGSLPNVPNALEQQQMAFYESLGNSWMPQPSVASEATQPGVVIVRPPLSNGIEVAAYSAPPLQWPIVAQQPPPEPFYYIPEANGVANLEANIVPSPVNGDLEEAANSSASVENRIDPLMALPAGPSSAGTSNETQNPPKKDKKKSKLATGLSLKKKNISSLVQKWQKIKKEQLREEEEVEGRKNTDQDGNISTTM